MPTELTINDMKRFLEDLGVKTPIVRTTLCQLGKRKKRMDEVYEELDNLQKKLLDKLGAPKDFYAIEGNIGLTKVGDKYRLTLDPNFFLMSFLYSKVPRNNLTEKEDTDELYRLNLLYYGQENEEEYKEEVITYAKKLKTLYNDIISKRKQILLRSNVGKDFFLDSRKALTWMIKHYDEILECFQEEVPDSILEQLNQDKLLLYFAHTAFLNSEYAEAKTFDDVCLKSVEYMNNYVLYARHQKELLPNYDPSYKYTDTQGTVMITAELFLKQMDLIEEYYTQSKNYGCKDFEELLKTKLIDLNRQIKKEQFRRDITLGWELIPESISKNERIRGIGRRTKTEAERKIFEEKKEALLEEKIELFNDLPYLAAIKGVNHFEGYFAYVFENGKVIFEKFYKKTKQGLVPTIDEAIYVIGIESFAELSRQSKGEIRDFIKEGKDKKAKVINHTKTFKQRVRNEIKEEGYTQEVMDYIDALMAKEEKNHEYQLRK